MRIAVLTTGTHGDIQPYIALGLGLQHAGHEVRLATHSNYEPIIRSRGLDFFPVEGNFREIFRGESGQACLESGRNPFNFIRRYSEMMCPLMKCLLNDSWNACQDAEVIIYAISMWHVAQQLAEKLKVPFFGAYYLPLTPTRAYPSSGFPTGVRLDGLLGGIYNQLTYKVSQELFWHLFRKAVNEARQAVFHLPPVPFMSPFKKLRKQGNPVLYGFSPSILPKPPDWEERIHVTGYWFLDRPSDWQPPSDLVDFLNSGSPPVYIGFGSMTHRAPEQMVELVLKALNRTKQRGVLQMGWGALSVSNADLPEDVFKIDFIPFDWLFPKMAVVVHHGGAGTTSAGVRAGIPSIVVPFFADQFFWGQRLFQLGAGVKPIPQKHLSVERLSDAINTAIHDKDMQIRAAALGQRVRAENGVAQAVTVFHRYVLKENH